MSLPEDIRPKCVIIGGGGHARVVIDCLQAAGKTMHLALLDSDPALWGRFILGVPVLGGDQLLADLAHNGTKHFIVGIGAIGDNRRRQAMFERALELDMVALSVQHPSATVARSVDALPGSQLLPGCIVNAGARIGCNAIINSGAIVEHDCTVGDHAHVATGALLAGAVLVGNGAHIGAGAVVRQAVRIGAGAIVGAGAVVVKDVAAGTLVIGVPAAPVCAGNRT
jgi:sugar O-acyltransferase (sialic acid O-acetyltransferase NeuD family)